MSKKDQITPKLVHQFVRSHDRHARKNRKDWSLYKHTYMTRYWEYMNGDDTSKRSRRLREVEVEVKVKLPKLKVLVKERVKVKIKVRKKMNQYKI